MKHTKPSCCIVSPVQGVLPDGREIAVKRLFYNNRHRAADFYNEVNIISSVEHKNLVRLLGCSCSGPESLLIYEFLSNKSLDRFIFGISLILKQLLFQRSWLVSDSWYVYPTTVLIDPSDSWPVIGLEGIIWVYLIISHWFWFGRCKQGQSTQLGEEVRYNDRNSRRLGLSPWEPEEQDHSQRYQGKQHFVGCTATC